MHSVIVWLYRVQWNSSKPDTIGTRVFFCYKEVSVTQGFMCVHNRLYTIIGWSRAWMRYLPSWVTFETISCSYIPAKVLVCCVRNMKCYFFTVHCIGRYRGACLYYEISKCPHVWGVDSCKQDVSEQWEEAMVNHIQGIAVWIIMTSLPECYVYRSSHVQCVHTHTHKYTHTHTLHTCSMETLQWL